MNALIFFEIKFNCFLGRGWICTTILLFCFLERQKKKVENIGVSFAITDISAMEVQFHSRRIPCSVVLKENKAERIHIPKRMLLFYKNILFDKVVCNSSIPSCPNDIIDYMISYSLPTLKHKTYSERIQWLCNYVYEDKKIKTKLLESIY